MGRSHHPAAATRVDTPGMRTFAKYTLILQAIWIAFFWMLPEVEWTMGVPMSDHDRYALYAALTWIVVQLALLILVPPSLVIVLIDWLFRRRPDLAERD